MLPTWQTIGLLVKETEQFFPGLGSRNACSGQGVSCHKQVLPESSWEMLLCQQMGDSGLTGNRTESTGWLCVGGMREKKSHSLEVMLLSQQ